MFEKLLENVLVQYFGKYIDGIDEKSIQVGVFSGDLRIQNVSFKPTCLDELNLPIDVLYSHIGMLSANITWSKLGSTAVPITLSDIYLVIGPRKDWAKKDSNFLDKFNQIEEYARILLEKILNKSNKKQISNDATEELGYLAKMGLKIADNIQLVIKNVHVRWQDDSDQGVSFGLSLNGFTAITTDSAWNESYIDRTTKANKNQSIYKLVTLTELTGYSTTSNDFNVINSSNKNKSKQELVEILKRVMQNKESDPLRQQIFSINGTCKITSNQQKQIDLPQYQLDLQFEDINIKVDKSQLQAAVDLINLTSAYKRHLNRQTNKRIAEEMTLERKTTLKSDFSKIFSSRLKSYASKEKMIQLSKQEESIIKDVVLSIGQAELLDSVMVIVRDLGKDLKVQELRSKKKGFFSFSSNTVVSEDQIKEIEGLIEAQIEIEKQSSENEDKESIRPDDSVKIKGTLQLSQATLTLVAKKERKPNDNSNQLKNSNETVELSLSCRGVNAVSQRFEDGERKMRVQLSELEVTLDQQKIITRISDQDLTNSKKDICYERTGLVDLEFFSQKAKDNSLINKRILKGEIASLQFNWNAQFLIYMTSILSLSSKERLIDREKIADSLVDKISSQIQEVANQSYLDCLQLQLVLQKQTFVLNALNHDNTKIISTFTASIGPTHFNTFIYQNDVTGEDNIEKRIESIGYELSVDCMEIKRNREQIIKEFSLNVKIALTPQLQLTFSLSDLSIIGSTDLIKEAINVIDTQFSFSTSNNSSNILKQQAIEIKKSKISNAQLNCSVSYQQRNFLKSQPCNLVIDQYDYLYLYNPDQIVPFFSSHLSHFADSMSYQQIDEDNPLNNQNEEHKSNQRFVYCYKQTWRVIFEDLVAVNSNSKFLEVIERVKEDRLFNLDEQYQSSFKLLAQEDQQNQQQANTDKQQSQKEASGVSPSTAIYIVKLSSLQILLSDKSRPSLELKANEAVIHTISQSKLAVTINIQLKLLQIVHAQHEHPLIKINSIKNKSPVNICIVEDLIQEQIIISGDLQQVLLNWKPDSMLALHNIYEDLIKVALPSEELDRTNLLALIDEVMKDGQFKQRIALHSTHNSEQRIPVDLQKEQAKILCDFNECCKLKVCSEKILCGIDLSVQELSIFLFTPLTHLPMLQVQLLESRFTTKFADKGMFVTAEINDITAFDLTNYPFTFQPKQNNSNNHSKILSKQLVGVSQSQNKSSSLLSIKYSLLKQFVTSQHVDSFLVIELQPMQLTYSNQLYLRYIDYFQESILSLIIHPTQLRSLKNNKSAVLGSLEQLLTSCFCPQFTHVQVQAQGLTVRLDANHSQIDQGLVLDLGSLEVKSQFEFNPQRVQSQKDKKISIALPIQGMWTCKYNIKAEQCVVYSHSQYRNDNSNEQLSLPFSIDLLFNKLLFAQETFYLWPNTKDYMIQDHKISGEISPLLCSLTGPQYVTGLTAILHNFTFDDLRNNQFASILTLATLQRSIQEFLKFSDLPHQRIFVAPVEVKINMKALGLLKTTENPQEDELMVLLEDSELEWIITGDNVKKIKITSKEIKAEIIKDRPNNKGSHKTIQIIGQSIGDFSSPQKTNENNIKGASIPCESALQYLWIYQAWLRDNCYQLPIGKKSIPKSSTKLLYTQIIQPNDDTSINIELDNIHMLLQTDTFLELFDWAKPKPSCYPQYLIRDEESRLVVIFSAKNVVAAFPAQLCQQVIALRGNLSLIFVRQRMQSHQILRGKLMGGEMEQKDLGDLYTYNVTLDGLEIFSCDFNQLMTVDFSEVSKRSLLCPLTASFKSKYELCIGPKPQQSLYFLARNEGQVQNLKLKFSFNNLQLLFKTLHQQTVFMKVLEKNQDKDKLGEEELNKDSNIIEEKKDDLKKQDNNSLAQQQQLYKEKYEIPTNSTFDVEIDEISVQLINDFNQCSIPLLSLRLNENKFLYNFSGDSKKSLSVSICMQLCYYNAQCSFWEPIIERTQIIVDFVSNQQSNPKKFLSIELGEAAELNVNISTNMLLSLKESLQTLNSQVEQFLEAIKGKGNDEKGIMNDIEDRNNQIISMYKKSNIQSSNMITSGIDGEDEVSSSDIASKKNKENVEQISPFSIQNNLGYALIVENERGQQYVIGNEQTVNYMIDEEESAEYASINSKTVSLTILSDKCTYPAITDVNLGWLKSRKVLISSEVVNGRISDGAIVLENSIQTTNKLLKIHSPLSIQNNTDQTMIVKVSPDQNMSPQNTVSITIVKQSTSYIPFDRTQNVFQFRFDNPESAFSDLISLAKLCKLEAETSFQLKHGKNKALTTFLQIQKLENETKLVLEPFITVKNCLPMRVHIGLLIENERKDVAEGELNYQEEFQTSLANLSSKVIMQLKVPGFQGSDYLTLSLPLPTQASQQRNIFMPQEHFIIDYRGQSFALSIKSQVKRFGAKKFFIYSQCLIICSVPNDLYFFYKKGDSILLASGQKVQNIPQTENVNHLGKITLLQNNPSIFISCSEKGTKLSRPLNITGIGNDIIDVYTSQGTSNNVIEVSADVSLQEVDKELKLFSKIIQLTPKYIIVNETEFSFMLRQENAEKEVILINPGERIPLTWTDATKPRNYNVMVTDAANKKAYGWSGTLNMGLSTISFAVRNPAKFSETMHLKATIKSYQHYFFLHFLQLKPNVNPSYTIKNDLKFARLVVYQGCFFNQKNASYKENYYHIDEGCEIDYAQDLPTLANDLIVEIQFYGNREGYVLEALVLDLECPEQQSEIVVGNMNNQNQLVLYMSQSYVGGVKSVVFREQKKVEAIDNGLDWQVAVNLPAVTLSLIGNVETVTKEIIFLNFKSIEFIFLSTSKDRIYQAKVQQIQVDNNTTLSTIYPVALTSSKQQSSVPHFSLVIEEDISVIQLTKIKSLRLAIQHSTLKLTDELIGSLLTFFNQFASPLFSMSSTQIYTPSDCKRINEDKDNNGVIYPFPWMTAEFPEQKGLVLIQQMELYPIGLNLSYKKIRETAGAAGSSSSQPSSGKSLNILQNALVAVGIAFANVEGASIKLKGIKYQNIKESSDAIFKRLLLSYKNSMIQQTLSILGSVSIIGNPVSLFKNIGTGVSDLIEMPIGGFIKGPIEGGVGIVLGAGSLIKNTVSGTFQSVQGITDSIGSGISQLSMDKEFMRSRDKIKKKKAKHVGQGVKLGLQSLFTGIGEGLVGVVAKPIQGAEKGGAFGLLKGITKGVAGLVFKPITGVIDAASKTAEGIKNTVTYFDDKATENRIRPPRVFYCRERYFQDYLIHDSELMSMLQTFKKSKYADYQLVSTNVLEYKGEQFILILTIQALMLFAVKHKQIIFHIPPQEIYSVMHTDKGLIVTTFNVIQELNCNEAELYIDSLPERGSIYKKIQNLIQQTK